MQKKTLEILISELKSAASQEESKIRSIVDEIDELSKRNDKTLPPQKEYWEEPNREMWKRIGTLFGLLIILLWASWGLLWFLSDIMDIKSASEERISPTNLLHLLATSAFLSSLTATTWAIQSYWRLRDVDVRTRKWDPSDKKPRNDWSNPFSFHELAESHKEWSELWFSWCMAICLSGVTYAIFSIGMHMNEPCSRFLVDKCQTCNVDWPHVVYNIINTQAPSSFIYLLFGFAWYWASKHYRSHWHNFVVNAYRHRALYRFTELRKNIASNIDDISDANKIRAEQTILELYRLSGILLLIPGDSSYMDKVGSGEISKAILQLEEIAKAFTGPKAKSGSD